MGISIEEAKGDDALNEFVQLYDKVYESRPVRWGALAAMDLPLLKGDSPFAEGRTLRPFVARQAGEVVARVLAAVDQRHQDRWGDAVGHVASFEALPQARQATRDLMDEACTWLTSQGMRAARAGFGLGEFPFVIDEYDTLPPNLVRQNPAYYHAFLKDAGFESEKGWVDYKITVTPELIARWEGALEAARVAGYDIVPLADVPEDRRVREFTQTWNEAFHDHWGAVPFTEAEVDLLFALLGPMGMLDLSVLAYRDGDPVGVLWLNPDMTAMAVGRLVRDDERLNTLGIGVLEQARGRGVNLAMSAHAYLELVRRGQTHMSYTLVLDDNWPSRRTAERLGAYVCANYMVYRRVLGAR